MFRINPFRRIKDLEFDVDVRDRTIENLKKEIEELKSPTRPKYHPNVTCTDCEYFIVENYGNVVCKGYYCRLKTESCFLPAITRIVNITLITWNMIMSVIILNRRSERYENFKSR